MRRLLIGAILAVSVAVPSLGATTGHAFANTTTSNGMGVGTFCQQYGQTAFSQGASYVLTNFFGLPVTVVLSQGACSSLVANFLAGTYDTSAPTVSICKALATSGYIGSDKNTQGQCVAGLSSSGFKQFLNYLIFQYGIYYLP